MTPSNVWNNNNIEKDFEKLMLNFSTLKYITQEHIQNF